jgi:phosphonate transport system substrate-binding protein
MPNPKIFWRGDAVTTGSAPRSGLAILSIVLLAVSLLSCSFPSPASLGSKENPIKFYFTPSLDANDILVQADRLMKLLERETGYFFSYAIPTSYIVVVEAFGTSRSDIAWMNSFGYLLAHQKYGAEARLRILRNGESSYRGEIITHVDSGINEITDLNKKKIAFVDPSSTSGYLLPLKLFKENDVRLGEQVFAMKHDNVVAMVYQRKVDAGACFYSPPDEAGRIKDARSRVMTQFPDVEEKVRIIKITDPIPNDPIVFRKDIPLQIKLKVEKALINLLRSEEGKRALYAISSTDGMMLASDEEYNVLRELISLTGKDIQELVSQ